MVKRMGLSALHDGRRAPTFPCRTAALAIASPTEKHQVCLPEVSNPSPGWGGRRKRVRMGSEACALQGTATARQERRRRVAARGG